MEIFEAITTRRSVRKYTDELPPLEDVEKIIDAARVAPSSTNDQMWEFIAVYNKDKKEQLRQAVLDKFDEMAQWEEAEEFKGKIGFYKHYGSFFADAPVCIAVIKTPRKSPMEDLLKERGLPNEEINRQRPNSALLSIGASIQNLSLAAHALGYGTCWMTAPMYAYEKMEKVLNVKEGNELVSLIALGRPSEDKGLTPKKELSEIMTTIM